MNVNLKNNSNSNSSKTAIIKSGSDFPDEKGEVDKILLLKQGLALKRRVSLIFTQTYLS